MTSYATSSSTKGAHPRTSSSNRRSARAAIGVEPKLTIATRYTCNQRKASSFRKHQMALSTDDQIEFAVHDDAEALLRLFKEPVSGRLDALAASRGLSSLGIARMERLKHIHDDRASV